MLHDGSIRNKNGVIYPLPVMDCDDDYSAPCQPCMEKSSNNRRQEAIIHLQGVNQLVNNLSKFIVEFPSSIFSTLFSTTSQKMNIV